MHSTAHVILILLIVLGVIWIGGAVMIFIADHLDARRTERLARSRARSDG